MIRLRVWDNLLPMGWLGHAAAQYFFEYDLDWVNGSQSFPLAPQFPLGSEVYKGEAVKTFFANLLPEGAPLTEILNQMHLRNANTLEMIGAFGADLPGVLSVLPQGIEPSSAQNYAVITLESLSVRIQACHRNQPLLTSNQQTRMSLAGAQEADSSTKCNAG